MKLVSDLFMSGCECWDENLIFYPHDAEEILKIRIQAGILLHGTMRRMVYFLLKVRTILRLI